MNRNQRHVGILTAGVNKKCFRFEWKNASKSVVFNDVFNSLCFAFHLTSRCQKNIWGDDKLVLPKFVVFQPRVVG